jgi:hypothetical protein
MPRKVSTKSDEDHIWQAPIALAHARHCGRYGAHVSRFTLIVILTVSVIACGHVHAQVFDRGRVAEYARVVKNEQIYAVFKKIGEPGSAKDPGYRPHIDHVHELTTSRDQVQQFAIGDLIVPNPKLSVVFYFTGEGHAAHPSVIRRIVAQHDFTVYTQTCGYTAGDRSLLESWLHLYLAQDERWIARTRRFQRSSEPCPDAP